MTAKNSRPHVHRETGRTYYNCRRCETAALKLRYHSDPDFREAALARGQAYKRARRAACEEVRA